MNLRFVEAFVWVARLKHGDRWSAVSTGPSSATNAKFCYASIDFFDGRMVIPGGRKPSPQHNDEDIARTTSIARDVFMLFNL